MAKKKKGTILNPSYKEGLLAKEALFIYSNMGLSQREGQKKLLEEMAHAIEKGYLRRKECVADALEGVETDTDIHPYNLFIGEAPVGTGKSYVILLLAFLTWMLYGKNTVLSTQTKVLQNQLYQKDFPAFKNILCELAKKGLLDPERVERYTARLVKGRENYLCFRQIKFFKEMADKSGSLLLQPLGIKKTVSISYAELDALEKDVFYNRRDEDRRQGGDGNEAYLLPYISAGVHNCIKGCPLKEGMKCPYFCSLLANAPLLITNHGLLRSLFKNNDDLSSGKATSLPLLSADNYIFDEAHHLMGYTTDSVIDMRSIKSSFIRLLLDSPLPKSGGTGLVEPVQDIRRMLWRQWQTLLLLFQEFFQAEDIDSDESKRSLLFFNLEKRAELFEKNEGLLRLLDDFAEKYRQNETLPPYFGKQLSFTGERLREIWLKAKNLLDRSAESLRSMPLRVDLEGIFYEDRETASMEYDMSEKLPNFSFGGFVSGTILINDDPGVFCCETGLSKSTDACKVMSPFSHKRVMLWTPSSEDFPNPSRNIESHYQAVQRFCRKYVPEYVASDLGGVLILCTSLRNVTHISYLLRPLVEKEGRVLLMQGEMPRARLVKTFLNNKSSVLVATNSFREGFDAPLEKLTWVILDKLPFYNPSNLQFRHRMEKLSAEGEISDVFRHSVTLMCFDLIQSLGRLERSEYDWGTLTVLDPRFSWMREEYIQSEAGRKNRISFSVPSPLEKVIPFSGDPALEINTLLPVTDFIRRVKRLEADAQAAMSAKHAALS